MPAEGQAAVVPVHSFPDLVLAIEEPELYQHPSRQRHIAKILLQLQGKIPADLLQQDALVSADVDTRVFEALTSLGY